MASAARVDRSAERAVLDAAVRAFGHGHAPPDIGAVAGPLDWDWILRQAEEQRIAAMLYSLWRAHPSAVPILDRLRAVWTAFQRQHLLGVETLRGMLTALEAAGVSAIPLKGPALADVLYREPGARPFTDLDIFVGRRDVPRVLEVLTELGYRHFHDGRSLDYSLAHAAAMCLVPRDRAAGLPVDVHWELVDPPGLGLPPAIDVEEVLRRAVPISALGRTVTGLCPEDLLIYLAAHLALHHPFGGLVWELDLALLIRCRANDLDWEAVAERARRWRLARAVRFALAGVEQNFDVGIPSTILVRLRPGPIGASVIDRLRRAQRDAPGRFDYVLPLLLFDQGRDLLRAVVSTAFPPVTWARRRYERRSWPLAYLAHYARIGRICTRTARAKPSRGSAY